MKKVGQFESDSECYAVVSCGGSIKGMELRGHYIFGYTGPVYAGRTATDCILKIKDILSKHPHYSFRVMDKVFSDKLATEVGCIYKNEKN